MSSRELEAKLLLEVARHARDGHYMEFDPPVTPMMQRLKRMGLVELADSNLASLSPQGKAFVRTNATGFAELLNRKRDT